MVKPVDGYINLEFVVRKEDHQYSSWCPYLDIGSCGDTPEEAVKNLSDALGLYLDTIEEAGELKSIFKERGIKVKHTDEPVVPRSFVTQHRQKVCLVAK